MKERAVLSVIESGFAGHLAEIECAISNGLPTITIVGMANKAVDEAKERIRSAFSASAIPLPKKRIVINLSPADIPKQGASFDLAIALSILTASQQVKPLSSSVVIGELGLDGSVRGVRGIIGKLMTAKQHGIPNAFIPQANAAQASLVPDITVYPIESLKQLYLHASNETSISAAPPAEISEAAVKHDGADFADIVGQAAGKRALEIAAAGGHNILLSGPPGTGKSLLAKALPSILPPMQQREILETTQIHSLASAQYEKLIATRPFRAPHHSASDTAIVGGGQNPRPGEISLAHNGVLLFDEFPEFRRGALEALRQPLEDGCITVSRAKDSLNFPARFILVATANPCPCGYHNTHRECVCSMSDILRYQRKLSGPIIDRIDLYVDVEHIEHKQLLGAMPSEKSAHISKRVLAARETQATRFGTPLTNARLTNRDIKQLLTLSEQAKTLLNAAAQKLSLSPRAYMRTIKVAQTIADLDQSPSIKTKHVAEAIQYRPKFSQNL